MKTRFAIAVCSLAMASTLSHAAELYVAPDGNDANPGTRAAPLKTLEAARDALRKLKGGQSSLAGGADRLASRRSLSDREDVLA